MRESDDSNANPITGIPAWAYSALSDELANLAAVGEGQHVEFKSEFPENIH